MKIWTYIINMISAELTIIPIGTSQTSISKYIAAALRALDETGINYEINGMGTMLESDDPVQLFEAVQKAHDAVFAVGAERVATSIKIDDRRDKEGSLKQKVKSVEEKLD
jgi:uncharacterized protein (TIGR00106 family)